MIRGGLWQKQKRTPVCSLCLYRECVPGPFRRDYSSSTRPASWGRTSQSTPSQPSNAFGNQRSVQFSNTTTAGFNHGYAAAGSAEDGTTSTGGPGAAPPSQRPSWGGSASWGSTTGTGTGSASRSTGGTYELSPSELAAKERLADKMKTKAAAQDQLRNTTSPSPLRAPKTSAKTLGYIGSMGRQDQRFSRQTDPFAPIDLKGPASLPPLFKPRPTRQNLGLDGGNWGRLQPRPPPPSSSSGLSSVFSSFKPEGFSKPTGQSTEEFWARAKQKYPSVEPPLGRPKANEPRRAPAAVAKPSPKPIQSTGSASQDAWAQMSAIAMESEPRGGRKSWTRMQSAAPASQDSWATTSERTTKSAPASQNAGAKTSAKTTEPTARSTPTPTQQPSQSTGPASRDMYADLMSEIGMKVESKPTTPAPKSSDWDWADELPEKTPKAAERPSSHQVSAEDQGGREITPDASATARRHGFDQTRETRGPRDGDRARRGRRDEFVQEERGRKGKTQRRDHREPAEEDFDEESFADQRRRRAQRKAAKERYKQQALEEAGPQTIVLPELISVANLGAALGIKTNEFLHQLGEMGFENITKDNVFTGETAALVAQEYGFDPQIDLGDDEDLKPRPPPEDPSSLPLRPPVVTIMGHVDHGKTTLLDYLRKSSIVEQEHGGITQHIGAFSVNLSSGKLITFLDTPGHAAFLNMRQRGANVTDMVILVVAADDSIKPQTLEALKHVRAAKVPMIVAINKVDKDSANVDRVKTDLAANGVEIEDYGGDVQVVAVSGKTGQGMDDLEENILLLAEMLDIRSETDGMAEGWVLESSIKPIGRVATVLVKRGTLRPGDSIVAGSVFARIRTLRNEAGQEVEEAPPGTAVEILGWKEPPAAGDQVLQAPSEDRAKRAAHYRLELKDRHEAVALQNQQDQERRDKAAAEELEKEMKEGGEEATAEAKEPGTTIVNFIVKGDVNGSVEACCASVLAIGNNEVQPRVLLSGPGQITEWEVEHAQVTGSSIINFNNAIPGHVQRLADEAGVQILDHNVIYHMAEDVRDRLSTYLAPRVVTKALGEIEILQIFHINVHGRVYKPIAGCKVRNGQVLRKSKVRVMRDNEEIFKGTIDALKQGKKDATEVKKGSECGISFDSDWADFREGDIIQPIEEITEKRTL